MPVIRLTKSVVPTLTCEDKKTVRYFDTKITGFGVAVNPGSSSYIVKARLKHPDRTKRTQFVYTIGRTDAIPFNDAVEIASRIIEDAAKGISPADRERERAELEAATLRAKLAEEQKNITFAQVLTAYIEARPRMEQSSIESYRFCIDNHLADWKDIPLRDIRKDMVLLRHAQIGRDFPAQADKVMRVLRAVINYCMGAYDDIVLSNPVMALSATRAWFRVGRRRNYIHASDLGKWFTALETLSYPPSQMALLLMLFTGARKGEVFGLKWSDCNLTSGEILFRETKQGLPLHVPICKYMVDRLTIYREGFAGYEYVLPSTNNEGHLSDVRTSIANMVSRGSPKFTPHDLRRTFQTYCEDLSIPIFTIKRLVGHALPTDVTEGYIQFAMPKLREKIESVAAYILRNAGLVGCDNVVEIKKARGGTGQ